MGTPEDAAIRETREEFGINIADIIPVTLVSGMSEDIVHHRYSFARILWRTDMFQYRDGKCPI